MLVRNPDIVFFQHCALIVRRDDEHQRKSIPSGVETFSAIEVFNQICVHSAVVSTEAGGQRMQVYISVVSARRVGAINAKRFIAGDGLGNRLGHGSLLCWSRSRNRLGMSAP